MADEAANFKEMRDLVYMTYIQCPVQKIATRRIIQEVQRGKLMWAHESATGKVHQKQIQLTTKEHKIWSNFMAEMIVQLKVFGYAVYRMTKVRNSKSRTSQYKGENTNMMDEGVRLEVANGQGINLIWNQTYLEWDVFADGDFTTPLHRKNWNVVFFNSPYKVGSRNQPILSSAAAGCQIESAMYADLKRRINDRDRINTRPCVYTTVSRNLTTTGQSTKPWFSNSITDTNAGHIPVPGVSQDFGTLLRDRLDTMRELDKLSKEARQSTRKAYESGQRMQLHSIHEEREDHEKVDPIEATEMFITDGREAREMSHRHGPPEIHQVIDRLVKEIYFSYDVTPQASGMSGNAERLTSSDRLARIAISVTEHHIAQVRDVLQQAIRKVSSSLSGDDSGSTYVQIMPCLNISNLQMVESFLKLDALADAYTCIMEGIPITSIDMDALATRQRMLLMGDKKGEVVPEGETKKKLTEEQLTARLNAKAQ